MKHATATLLALSILGGAFAQEEPADPGRSARVRQWILNLGSDDPNLRDWAEARLREAGALALPDLRRACASTDPEVAFRAEKLVKEIEAAGRPATPEKRAAEEPRVVSVRQAPDGRVTVVVQRERDGEVVEEEVAAASLAELRRRHPDLAKQIGVLGKKGSDPADQPLEVLVKDLMDTVQKTLDVMTKARKKQGKRGGLLHELVEILDQEDEPAEAAPEPKEDEAGDVPADLAAHLGLAPGAGALMGDLPAESRWTAAGLRAYDVVVAVNGSPVQGGGALDVLARAAAATGELKLEIVRRGKRSTVGVPAAMLGRFK